MLSGLGWGVLFLCPVTQLVVVLCLSLLAVYCWCQFGCMWFISVDNVAVAVHIGLQLKITASSMPHPCPALTYSHLVPVTGCLPFGTLIWIHMLANISKRVYHFLWQYSDAYNFSQAAFTYCSCFLWHFYLQNPLLIVCLFVFMCLFLSFFFWGGGGEGRLISPVISVGKSCDASSVWFPCKRSFSHSCLVLPLSSLLPAQCWSPISHPYTVQISHVSSLHSADLPSLLPTQCWSPMFHLCTVPISQISSLHSADLPCLISVQCQSPKSHPYTVLISHVSPLPVFNLPPSLSFSLLLHLTFCLPLCLSFCLQSMSNLCSQCLMFCLPSCLTFCLPPHLTFCLPLLWPFDSLHIFYLFSPSIHVRPFVSSLLDLLSPCMSDLLSPTMSDLLSPSMSDLFSPTMCDLLSPSTFDLLSPSLHAWPFVSLNAWPFISFNAWPFVFLHIWPFDSLHIWPFVSLHLCMTFSSSFLYSFTSDPPPPPPPPSHTPTRMLYYVSCQFDWRFILFYFPQSFSRCWPSFSCFFGPFICHLAVVLVIYVCIVLFQLVLTFMT